MHGSHMVCIDPEYTIDPEIERLKVKLSSAMAAWVCWLYDCLGF